MKFIGSIHGKNNLKIFIQKKMVSLIFGKKLAKTPKYAHYDTFILNFFLMIPSINIPLMNTIKISCVYLHGQWKANDVQVMPTGQKNMPTLCMFFFSLFVFPFYFFPSSFVFFLDLHLVGMSASPALTVAITKVNFPFYFQSVCLCWFLSASILIDVPYLNE